MKITTARFGVRSHVERTISRTVRGNAPPRRSRSHPVRSAGRSARPPPGAALEVRAAVDARIDRALRKADRNSIARFWSLSIIADAPREAPPNSTAPRPSTARRARSRPRLDQDGEDRLDSCSIARSTAICATSSWDREARPRNSRRSFPSRRRSSRWAEARQLSKAARLPRKSAVELEHLRVAITDARTGGRREGPPTTRNRSPIAPRRSSTSSIDRSRSGTAFRNGYDPNLRLGGTRSPTRAAHSALGDYARFPCAKKLVGVHAGDDRTIVGDPIGRDAIPRSAARRDDPPTRPKS